MSTLERLKKKRTRLLAELDQAEREIAALSAVPAQVSIPGLAPVPAERKLSVYEEDHAEFMASRLSRLKKLNVDPVPDVPQQPAFINTRMRALREACGDDDGVLFAVFDAFLNSDWAAGLTPPFPFRALASEKVFSRLIQAVRA